MKTAWIWIVVIVLLIIGGFYFFRSRSDVNNSMTATTTGTTTGTTGTNGSNTIGMKKTLGGIFDDPGSYQCDYEQVSQTSRSTNVVYISNGKLRGEFRTQTATSSTLSLVVYDGTYAYVWTEGKTTGKVTQPKTLAELPGIIPEDLTSGKVLGQGLNNTSWNCHAWSKVDSKLVRPSNVTFN